MEVKNENGVIKYTFNSEEEKVIDWAVKRIIDCYIAKGGDKNNMMSENEIRLFCNAAPPDRYLGTLLCGRNGFAGALWRDRNGGGNSLYAGAYQMDLDHSGHRPSDHLLSLHPPPIPLSAQSQKML